MKFWLGADFKLAPIRSLESIYINRCLTSADILCGHRLEELFFHYHGYLR